MIQTPLNSPVQDVVRRLQKGMRLRVQKAVSLAGIVRIEVLDSENNVAGSVTSAQMMRLLECIENGVTYVAVVINEPQGGLVNLRIEASDRS